MPSNVSVLPSASVVSGMTWMPRSHSSGAPASMPSAMSRRWKSGSNPAASWASSQTSEWTPATGFQWNFTSTLSPPASTSRKVWTPKPSMVRKERGMPRSLMFQNTWWVASVCRETKSQKPSWADCACGISTSGRGFPAWMMSGNLMPSWMKNTGMLLPTRSKLPSSV